MPKPTMDHFYKDEVGYRKHKEPSSSFGTLVFISLPLALIIKVIIIKIIKKHIINRRNQSLPMEGFDDSKPRNNNWNKKQLQCKVMTWKRVVNLNGRHIFCQSLDTMYRGQVHPQKKSQWWARKRRLYLYLARKL